MNSHLINKVEIIGNNFLSNEDFLISVETCPSSNDFPPNLTAVMFVNAIASTKIVRRARFEVTLLRRAR